MYGSTIYLWKKIRICTPSLTYSLNLWTDTQEYGKNECLYWRHGRLKNGAGGNLTLPLTSSWILHEYIYYQIFKIKIIFKTCPNPQTSSPQWGLVNIKWETENFFHRGLKHGVNSLQVFAVLPEVLLLCPFQVNSSMIFLTRGAGQKKGFL